jgi:hypothetical protein
MSADVGPNIIEDGLVLALDASDPRSYAGSGTTWFDRSGNGNNGTLVNGPVYSTLNRGAFTFDGVNDTITFNNITTSSLGLTSSNGATMSCWMKITLLSRWTGVYVFYNTQGSCDFGWDITLNNQLRIWKGNNITSSVLTPYSDIWTNFVLVSNSTGTIFYINGIQFSTTNVVGNVPFTTGRNLIFGKHWDSAVSGNLSNLSIYNRALSASEIAQNFNATRSRFGI